ncbi:MAG: threonine dehydrogenase [Deltaproteobacteria bacterium]|jgi:threonine dehydrogenase-like Zn-dependent dehydrogenase|nr:MAG: threonine dehydrogenase [Deltaproteobacteria bacterium]
MKALVVRPGIPNSASIKEIEEPVPDSGSLLVETLAVGICGTDREIVGGSYGSPPAGQDYLVLGHESLGKVLYAPKESGFYPGDLVVGIVRHPDPVPCDNCAVGEWDMCSNGLYTEHGIKQLHGFCSERFCIEPEYAVKIEPALHGVGVLVEPASVVAKAWEHIERIGKRARWNPRRVLVTGAGPIGLLAAMMGIQRGLDVHIFDIVTGGLKPALVKEIGGTYHTGNIHDIGFKPDVVLECTGVGKLVFEVMQSIAPNGIVCLTGISSGKRLLEVDVTSLNRGMVLGNEVVFGTVNANRRHYEAAASSLAMADRAWLERLITRRVPFRRWAEALSRQPDDVKVVVDFTIQ